MSKREPNAEDDGPQKDALVEITETLNSVDTNSPDAKANKESFDNNQGQRIKYKRGQTRSHLRRIIH